MRFLLINPSFFEPMQQKIFVRIDKGHIEHNHRMLEMIARKA